MQENFTCEIDVCSVKGQACAAGARSGNPLPSCSRFVAEVNNLTLQTSFSNKLKVPFQTNSVGILEQNCFLLVSWSKKARKGVSQISFDKASRNGRRTGENSGGNVKAFPLRSFDTALQVLHALLAAFLLSLWIVK